MLSNIQITDNFKEIEAIYKQFKHSIFNLWCEYDQYELDSEEKKLINTISLLLDKENSATNQEDNLIQALIGARVLSKFSIMNQIECVNFYTIIGHQFPQSIQKRRFVLKCIAKKCQSNTTSEWDNYIINIHDKILSLSSEKLENYESIANYLIFINFLIKYAPDFVSKLTKEIFSHLLIIMWHIL